MSLQAVNTSFSDIGAYCATKLPLRLQATAGHSHHAGQQCQCASVCHRARAHITWGPVRPSGPWARSFRPSPAPCRLRRARPCPGFRRAWPARPTQALKAPICVHQEQSGVACKRIAARGTRGVDLLGRSGAGLPVRAQGEQAGCAQSEPLLLLSATWCMAEPAARALVEREVVMLPVLERVCKYAGRQARPVRELLARPASCKPACARAVPLKEEHCLSRAPGRYCRPVVLWEVLIRPSVMRGMSELPMPRHFLSGQPRTTQEVVMISYGLAILQAGLRGRRVPLELLLCCPSPPS